MKWYLKREVLFSFVQQNTIFKLKDENYSVPYIKSLPENLNEEESI